MKLRSLFAIFALAVFAGAAAAQTPTRIAVVDVNRVIADSAAGKAATAKLTTLQETRVAPLKRLQGELDQLTKQLQDKNSKLSAAALETLRTQAEEKQRRLVQGSQDAEREIGAARDRELQALETKLKPIIESYAKEVGFAAIFNKFESGLVFAADSIDITDELIKRANRAQP
ncbi:MAG: hypothetical protein C0518_06985 [Opitutus sp.]|nr:hypothetical protein [Opitutus sp.]